MSPERLSRVLLGAAALLASCALDEEGQLSGAHAGSAGQVGSGGSAAGGTSGKAGASGFGGTSGGAGADAGSAAGAAGAAGTGGGVDSGAGGAAGCVAAHPAAITLVIGGSTHCYWLGATLETQTTAQDLCIAAGGYLATILSQAENNVVWSVAQTTYPAWIGLSRSAAAVCSKQDYQWMTGEPVVHEGWAAPDPDCSGSGVAMVEGGVWRDRAIASPYYYVCEAGPLAL